jgi:hypothetical protein
VTLDWTSVFSLAISICIHSNSINTSRGVEKQLADADKLRSVEAFSHHEAVGAERRVGFGAGLIVMEMEVDDKRDSRMGPGQVII